MKLTLARFYWPADAVVDTLNFPEYFQSDAGQVSVSIIDIPLTHKSIDALLTPPFYLEQWFMGQGLFLDTLCGVVIDNYYPPEHPDSSKIQRVFSLLAEELDVVPVINKDDLADTAQWEHFVEQMSILHEFNQLLSEQLTAHKLIEFHTRYKMQFLAHSQPAYRRLGPLVANIKHEPSLYEFAHQYRQHVMRLLRYPATLQNHTNVVMHLQGYFRKKVGDEARQRLTTLIHQYRLGEIPLSEVKTTLRELQATAPHGWLAQQRYLYPWFIDYDL
ncbi:DUF1722 domain-containing protein [Tatumella sp. TA1]|uniref:YbgA family protein n=1 Tax=Rosenbergiella collisarenosi TaxID=1544695 RepID=UPI0008F7E912|nr:DUF1722 domain-containing protein [Rosenbergiella collisarenosi]MBT0721665.1 DUF1722 domain-containing protein [Rosenbergiella collisarenosi]QGX90963.1 DUF1722 domain-containing protein [Tatumella sp. TA1]